MQHSIGVLWANSDDIIGARAAGAPTISFITLQFAERCVVVHATEQSIVVAGDGRTGAFVECEECGWATIDTTADLNIWCRDAGERHTERVNSEGAYARSGLDEVDIGVSCGIGVSLDVTGDLCPCLLYTSRCV